MIITKHFFSRKSSNVLLLIKQRNSASFRTNSHPLFAVAVPRDTYFHYRMASNLPRNAIFNALIDHDEQKTAIAHSPSHRKHTYGQLIRDVGLGRLWLDKKLEHIQTKTTCVAFLVDNGYEYVGARKLQFLISSNTASCLQCL